LLAALGLAIRLAWSGLLSNVAAGAFIVILRPFKTGDIVTIADITGKVEEVGLFMIIINTGIGRIYINNSKILNDNIKIHESIPSQQVDCQVQLDYTTDHNVAIELIRERVSQLPNVLAEPPLEIGIAGITSMGPVLVVKPGCAPQHCNQVRYDTNRVIHEVLKQAGFQVPRQRHSISEWRSDVNKDLKERAF
jgi:small conductance mechanosensitive channel